VAVAIWGTALLGSISGTVDSRSVLPVIALIIGIGMVVTGALFRSGLFVGAGWLWLAGGLAAFFAALPLQILLFAALDVMGYIVPGVYLMIHERRRPENG
jgi:membrane protein implicated in regulation of membrane protease activity